MLPLSICEKKILVNSNYEFLQLKTFTVLAWFTTFELAVKSYIDEYKRELRQHLKLWRKVAPFPPAKTPKTILDFKVVFFQTKVSYELLNYNTFLACVFVHF